MAEQSAADFHILWHELNREMHETFRRQVLREIDLPPMAHFLLRQLHHEPGVSVSELARRTGTVKSHVSKLIDQLVRKGYVEKYDDPADQRVLRVQLTPAGAAFMAELEGRVRTFWAQVLEQLPPGQVQQVAEALQVLRTAVRRFRSDASLPTGEERP